jgi:hypothetical protein
MVQLVYVSSASKPFEREELERLLAVARASNGRYRITGALMYSDGNFLQVLEGPDDAVQRVYAKICQDPRHRGILCLLSRPIEARSFPDWSMAWVRAGSAKAPDVPAWRAWDEMALMAREGQARTLVEVFARQHAPC